MGILIRADQVIEDTWIRLEDDTSIDHHQVIVSSSRLRDDWKALYESSVSLGVELEVTDLVEDIAGYLARLELVVLRFESFADGRAFSQARLLRERLGYTGLLRASGEVLRDQLAFMRRCGFDQFLLADGEEVDLALAAFSDINRSYQPEVKPHGL